MSKKGKLAGIEISIPGNGIIITPVRDTGYDRREMQFYEAIVIQKKQNKDDTMNDVLGTIQDLLEEEFDACNSKP